MQMERWQGRVVLVTGASSGIGAAICEVLVQHGMKVVGCARSVDKIQALARKLSGSKGTLYPERCDLLKENEILEMLKRIKAQHGGVDICINNAGVAHNASLMAGETNKWMDMLKLNVIALCICTREALESMKERNVDDGHIIHINSVGGHFYSGYAPTNFYSATKSCVRSLLFGLRSEIKATKNNIRVSEVSPGLVETNFVKQFVGEEKAKLVYKRPSLSPMDIANSVLHIIAAPSGVEINDMIVLPTQSKL